MGVQCTGKIGIDRRVTNDNESIRVFTLDSLDIEPGMSGSPVLDLKTNGIIGIISAVLSSTPSDRCSSQWLSEEALQLFLFAPFFRLLSRLLNII